MSAQSIITEILRRSKGKKIFAVFDRDGTLVPINRDPAAAILKENVLSLLLDLHSLPNTKVGILSARDMRQLLEDFRNSSLILAGNYGMEILLPKQSLWQEPRAKTSRKLLLKAKHDLEENLPSEKKTILEDHELTLCLHWHLTPEHLRNSLHSFVKVLASKYPELRFKQLPTSYEIWPDLNWDKAKGLETLTTMLNTDFNSEMILYVGDSDSDEPAFDLVNQLNGISIRIGKTAHSQAQFILPSAEQIAEFLALFLGAMQKH